VIIKDKLSLETYKKIKFALRRTKDTGREHGFVLCSNNEIETGDICVGTECNIKLKQQNSCVSDHNKIVLGAFHTHPNIYTPYGDLASIPDLYAGMQRKINGASQGVVCISESDYPKYMQCYIPKRNLNLPSVIIQQILNKQIPPDHEESFLFSLYNRENINIDEGMQSKNIKSTSTDNIKYNKYGEYIPKSRRGKR
jgi:hypothetical protein